MVQQISRKFVLRAARLNRGLSRRQAAIEIGVTQPTLRKLEEGGVVHPAAAKKVADFFRVQVTDLMPLDADPDEAVVA